MNAINVRDVQKWVRVYVEKGVGKNQQKAGLEAFAEKFNCEPTKECVEEFLKIIYRKDIDRRKRVLKTLIANDKRHKHTKAAQTEVVVPETEVQETETSATEELPTVTEASDVEEDIPAILDTLRENLEWHEKEVQGCTQNLAKMQEDLENIRQKSEALALEAEELAKRAVSLEKQKKAVLWKASNENTRKIELESKILELSEKIAEYEKQEEERSALRLTLYKECVSETVALADLDGITEEKISQQSFVLMTANDFPKEFLELRGESISWNETKLLATILLVMNRIEKKAYWYFPKGNGLAAMLTYLGLESVIAE